MRAAQKLLSTLVDLYQASTPKAKVSESFWATFTTSQTCWGYNFTYGKQKIKWKHYKAHTQKNLLTQLRKKLTFTDGKVDIREVLVVKFGTVKVIIKCNKWGAKNQLCFSVKGLNIWQGCWWPGFGDRKKWAIQYEYWSSRLVFCWLVD